MLSWLKRLWGLRDDPAIDPDSSLAAAFDRLLQLDDAGIQMTMRESDKDKLIAALRGASETLRQRLYSNMGDRGALLLKEAIMLSKAGNDEIRDAQHAIMATVEALIQAGEIDRPPAW